MSTYDFILFTALIIVFYQDIKKRYLHLFTILYLLLSIVISNYFTFGYIVSMEIIFNLIYLTVLIGILFIYFKLRFKSWRLIDSGLGMGDVVFWVVISFYLNFTSFLIWFNLSLIVSLVIHFLLKNKLWYGSSKKIPLAGLQSMFLMFFILYKLW